MEVKSRHTGETRKINGLEDALEALSDVGCCCNGAYLISTELGGDVYSVFVYNALIYNPTHEQFIERPSQPAKLEKFLYKLFDPYLYKNDNRVRSIIKVHPLKRKEISQWEREWGVRKLFQLTMQLYLKREHWVEAANKLKSQSDSYGKMIGFEFCLD